MHYTPRFVIDALLSSIANLPPRKIAEAEAALATARRRAEAVVEIDAAAAERVCPRCASSERSSWGTTRTGARRWRCRTCEKTWSGRTGSPVAHIHRPGLFIELMRNMLDPNETPLSCRKMAHRLGLSKDTVWRWRMVILEHLASVPPEVMKGIVETDETYQRESRKGSREWVRKAASPNDPSIPTPPRRRWKDYGRKGPPQAIVRQWLRPLLGVVDRTGAASFQLIADTKQPTIDAALAPQVAGDAMMLFDGAPQYEAIARARGLSYKVLIAGRRSRTTPKAFHLNSVNGLHAEWKSDFRTPFRGPATKYLAGYARWMVARRKGGAVEAFRAILV
ncbi:IS1595 family transposase [Marinovum algicola]|uniref:IS1595 family transposase n=1 Tax=Marinovum algicola TaxID=42444 RepID=UPI0024BBCEC4|nr:IS1595 family transposase [Marinovum algicola]